MHVQVKYRCSLYIIVLALLGLLYANLSFAQRFGNNQYETNRGRSHDSISHQRGTHYTKNSKNSKIETDNFELRKAFQHPPQEAKPWVFWYWDQAAVSREGITADLKAMKEVGIGGAYLMTIKGPSNPPLINPPVEQLTNQWWQMIKFAMNEADRLGVKLAMHDCDGFAVAGGPWITPELSMQKLTWSKTIVKGGGLYNDTLTKPQANNGYYRDIAVFAYPANDGDGVSTETIIPQITTSNPKVDGQFLIIKGNKKSFSSDTACWIQYAFDEPFTCRSVIIRTNGNNFQAQRFIIQISDDGEKFYQWARLEPARSGWQDNDAPNSYAIKAVTARYFRLVYDKEGSEPGAEDLDAAKWKPNLKVQNIELSGTVCINQFEGKNGEVWRVAKRTTEEQVPNVLCVPKDKLINITAQMDASGHLNWNVPAGRWVILRMGNTSTGHMNETGWAGKGLECDKFNPEAIKLQFNNWFGEAVRQAGPDLTSRVLKIFHIDSWECGSQNWSPVFQEEFKKRRGYDLLPFLPVMAGVPLQSAEVSEKVLYDVRQTIAELLVDNFYTTMAKLAHNKGCSFSAESSAPTMVGDGMLQFSQVDFPMGEFWLRSPTHDKPSDVLDAISGGHIYGKNIIQSEAFTELRMAWDEHPGMLKVLGDRNFALGVNRFVLHVFNHNPWMDRKPGMTLDGVGLYFQRDQTWWNPGKAWITYLQRCQFMLQMGKPMVDVAVFTSEEVPRRSILPDRLVNVLPGIIGADVVSNEAKRLKNEGEPIHTMPLGVTSSANMAEPGNWVDPLRGYAYDSFNKDALLHLAKVKAGRIELPGGASYGLLVMPGITKMSPERENLMSQEVSDRIKQLVHDGATVLINDYPNTTPSSKSSLIMDGLEIKGAKGQLLKTPYLRETFDSLGLERDLIVTESKTQHAKGIAWTHRTDPNFDIYFISNQQDRQRVINLSVRVANKIPEIWDPLTGEIEQAKSWENKNDRTNLTLRMEPNGSCFVVLSKPAHNNVHKGNNWSDFETVKPLNGVWKVQFDSQYGGPVKPIPLGKLSDWSKNEDPAIRYYSGTADYEQSFKWDPQVLGHEKVWLDLGVFYNMATVIVNGFDCGVAWTPPYRLDITKALRNGVNKVNIQICNTWANRLIGDNTPGVDKHITLTTAPYRLDGKSLLPAGLLGPVKIVKIKRTND